MSELLERKIRNAIRGLGTEAEVEAAVRAVINVLGIGNLIGNAYAISFEDDKTRYTLEMEGHPSLGAGKFYLVRAD